jgi:hypothetical protein
MAAFGEMHIQTVVRNVQTPVGEPAVIGRARFIERLREGRLPDKLAPRKRAPESDVIGGRFLVQRLDIGALQTRVRGKIVGRRKAALFEQDGFDVGFFHYHSPHARSVAPRAAYRSGKRRGQAPRAALVTRGLAAGPVIR